MRPFLIFFTVVELNFNEIEPKVWTCSLPPLSQAAALPPEVEIKAATDLLPAPALALPPPLLFTQTSSICRLGEAHCSTLYNNNQNLAAIVELSRYCRTKAAEHKSRSHYNCERITLWLGRS